MKCQKCGSELQNGMSVCPVCGSSLSLQSNYKKLENQVGQFSNNNVNSNQNNGGGPIKPKSNKGIVILIIFITIVAIVCVLFFSGVLNRTDNDGGLKDVNTVNEGVDTITKKTSKSTKTTTTTIATTNISSGDEVVLEGLTFTIPSGFEFGYSSSEETRKYYLLRKDANAMISFNIKYLTKPLEEIFNDTKMLYQDSDTSTTLEEINTYNEFKYYKIIHKEEINRNKFKEHIELIMQIDNELYINAYIIEPEIFGEQNYMQILTRFLASKK